MRAHRGSLPVPLMIGVGAAFDFHTGRVRQAPRWMQENGLEWFFRLTQEPRRLWRRRRRPSALQQRSQFGPAAFSELFHLAGVPNP